MRSFILFFLVSVLVNLSGCSMDIENCLFKGEPNSCASMEVEGPELRIQRDDEQMKLVCRRAQCSQAY